MPFNWSSSNYIHIVFLWLDLLYNNSSPLKEEKRGEDFHKARMVTFITLGIYILWECKIFIKALTIMSLSTDVH